MTLGNMRANGAVRSASWSGALFPGCRGKNASVMLHLGASSGKPPIISTPANSIIGQEF